MAQHCLPPNPMSRFVVVWLPARNGWWLAEFKVEQTAWTMAHCPYIFHKPLPIKDFLTDTHYGKHI